MRSKNFKPATKLEQLMIHAYVNHGQSIRQIAVVVGMSPSTVNRWLSRLNIPRRSNGYGPKMRDITWSRVGRLTVVRSIPNTYPRLWTCICDCGNVRQYSKDRLRYRRSCGCAPKGRKPT